MKVLVTGVNGQLGFDVIKALKKRVIECIGTTREEFDIIDAEGTRKFINNYRPDVVIHCAAYTAVDRAEDEVALCMRVNVEGTQNVAKACKSINAKMIYISTDYVFPGRLNQPYEINAETEPINVYGESKLAGELAVKQELDRYFIVRISWVFGKNGNNFIKTMLRIGKSKEEVNVVSDQVGSPTYTLDLAELLCDMSQSEAYGIYHATNEGFCSWAELAEEAFKVAHYSTKVNYILTSEYPTKAVRPYNSRLSKTTLDQMFTRLPDWKDAVRRYIDEVKNA